jgi:hypothetical protein
MPVHTNHLKLPAMAALLTKAERRKLESQLGLNDANGHKPASPDGAPRLFD